MKRITMKNWKPEVWQMILILLFFPLTVPFLGVIAIMDVYRERDEMREKRKMHLKSKKRKRK